MAMTESEATSEAKRIVYGAGLPLATVHFVRRMILAEDAVKELTERVEALENKRRKP
jgi:hypothetical protein